MKIKFKNTNQVIDERLNRAQRLIRLGLAEIYVEPIRPPKPVAKIKKIKKIEEETEEKKSEGTFTSGQEYSTEAVSNWGNN
jgi:hypothetical protein